MHAGPLEEATKAYQAGDVRFVDISGPDGTPDGIINEFDKVKLGSSMPTMYGGVNLMLRYKQFCLDANFGYSIGGHIYNATRRQLESMSTFYNQSTAVLNRWQIEGQQAALPRAAYGDPMGNARFSDRWIEDGSFLKLSNVQLSYDIPYSNSYIQGITVWAAATNLYTFTRYLGADPEVSMHNGTLWQGIDNGQLANGRSFYMGVKINL